jgi:hypothetical protein
VSSKIAGVILNNAVEGLPYYYDYRYYGYGKNEPARIRRSSQGKKPEQDRKPDQEGQPPRATRMGGEA